MPQATDRWLLFLVVAAAAALAAALALQFLGGLPPCPFCVYQRYPYLVVIAVGALGLWLRRPRLALALAALALAVNVGLAAYHVGIEQGWLALPEGCAAAGARHHDRGAAAAARRRHRHAAIRWRSPSPACRSPPGTWSTPQLCSLIAAWALATGSAAEQDRRAARRVAPRAWRRPARSRAGANARRRP